MLSSMVSKSYPRENKNIKKQEPEKYWIHQY